jgi:chromosomal replication initiator protein
MDLYTQFFGHALPSGFPRKIIPEEACMVRWTAPLWKTFCLISPFFSGVIVMTDELNILWTALLSAAKEDLPAGAAEIWLKTCLPVSLSERRLVLDVPNVFVKEQIQTRFLPSLDKIAQQLEIAESVILQVGTEVRGDEQKRAERAAQPPQGNKGGLNPMYVFDSFVVGKANRLAHASSLAVAESPGVAYNPLFIWGGVGLGKTHLMHAIGHYVWDSNPSTKVVYVSSEKFTNELISAIQNNRTQDFKAKYRNVDVLLIDDIQFLANKESTQEEFFHTFNSLYDAKKQVVISSDRPPKEIQRIEERLVSRFEWGLVTDIQPPDLETRIAILQKKAEFRGYSVPEDVIYFLAQNIPSNIRELEGSLNRVVACSQLNMEPITVENVSEWLKDIIKSVSRGPVSVNLIQQLTAEAFGLSVEDLSSAKRTSEIALARQVGMYLCRELTEASLQQVGFAYNKKDHTTVLHACRKIEELVRTNIRVASIVDNIRKKL